MTRHCEWCQYDMPEPDAVVEGMLMHPECRVKYKRRERIDGELLPMLSALKVSPYGKGKELSLKIEIARLIEKVMDEAESVT